MFDVCKDFYTARAYQLLNQYENSQCYEKARFIQALIYSQTFFGSKSILDCELLLDRYYRPEIIIAVLSDLNYTLKKLRKKSDISLFGVTIKCKTLILFTNSK